MLEHPTDKFSGVPQRSEVREVELEQILPKKDDRFRLRHEPESGIESDVDGFASEYPVAKRMKRRYPHLARTVRQGYVYPLLHLSAGFFGEGESEDFLRYGTAGGNKIFDALGNHRGLACPGTSNNENWPVAKGDGLFLLDVELSFFNRNLCHRGIIQRLLPIE